MTIADIGPIGPALSLLAVAGVVVSYLVLRREMRAELEKLRGMVQEAGKAEKAPSSVAKPAVPTVPTSPAPVLATPKPVVAAPAPAKDEVTPEILAVIAAAVAQFVGAGARIRSTRMVAAPSGMSAWAQQGRVIIQASHNLGVR